MMDTQNQPMVPMPFRVQHVRRETHDTFTLELRPTDASRPLPFAPGQFNMLYMFGVGEVPISISGDPAQPERIVHTTRVVGTVTKAMRALKANDYLGVRGPFGAPWPLDKAQGNDVMIIAGGIGLAPLRPAVYRLLSQREKFGKVVILSGTRTPADILFRKEMEQWRSRFDVDVFTTVDRAMSGWKGNVGVVTTLIARAPVDPQNSIAMVCGPEVMMRFTVMELQKRGIGTDRIYVSMERNMKCGVGLCGHCQYGPSFVCKDGPVYPFDRIKDYFVTREI
jgi:NAD(P)H-flavin reductase